MPHATASAMATSEDRNGSEKPKKKRHRPDADTSVATGDRDHKKQKVVNGLTTEQPASEKKSKNKKNKKQLVEPVSEQTDKSVTNPSTIELPQRERKTHIADNPPNEVPPNEVARGSESFDSSQEPHHPGYPRGNENVTGDQRAPLAVRDASEQRVTEEAPALTEKKKKTKRNKREKNIEGPTIDDASPVKRKKRAKKPYSEHSAGDDTPFELREGSEMEDVVLETPRKTKKHHANYVDSRTLDSIHPEDDGVSVKKKLNKSKYRPEEDELELGEEGLVGSSALDSKNPSSYELIETTIKRKKKKRNKSEQSEVEPLRTNSMQIDSAEPKQRWKPAKWRPADASERPEFPFFTQVVSLYVPLAPVSFDRPITGVGEQHLRPLLNHYSSQLGGVLLRYSNVNFSGTSRRLDPNNPTSDSTPAILESIESFAPAFGWMTAEIDLFVPKRGCFMEGTVNLQNEGHLGLVCWGKFNASIEAKRLPRDWRFVETEESEMAQPPPAEPAEDEADEERTAAVSEMYSTGFWVSGAGQKIKGRLLFRVKNFDVGVAGENGFLSIEGTMLTEADEKEAVADEMETARRRKLRMQTSVLQRQPRRVPEASVTRMGKEYQEEDSGQRVEVYKGSRPTTPDD